MSAYRDALSIAADSSEQRVALAAELLASSDSVVLLEGMLALRPTSHCILCEVIDPMPNSHRCAEEFKVLVENAARALEASRLGKLMPAQPLRLLVVEDYGTGTVEIWPGKHEQGF